jgi:hypothetical protein
VHVFSDANAGRATPYVLDYDLVVLAVVIAFFARDGLSRGFGGHEITLLALG